MSTITAQERTVFDRIFKDLVAGQRPIRESNDSSFLDVEGSDKESLETVFNEAFKKVEDRSQKRQDPSDRPLRKDSQGELVRQNVSSSCISFRSVFPPLLQRSLDSARAKYRANRARQMDVADGKDYVFVKLSRPKDVGEGTSEPADDYERLVRDMRREDMYRVTALLREARTDIEIWRVLEKEVFYKATELDKFLKQEEKAKKAAMATTKHRSPKKAESVNPISTTPSLIGERSDSTTSNLTGYAPNDPIAPATEKALSKGIADTSSALAPTVTISPISTPHPLSILQTNYAPLLLLAMRLLRTRFPCSTYAPALIPHVKQLGPISYVLGASIALYNEMLYIRWVHYRDMHACADLVQEMVEQGVGTDDTTGRVFRDAKMVRAKEMSNFQKNVSSDVQASSKVATVWWNLQGVSSGWERWREAEREAARERKEEEVRRAREMIEMETREGEDEIGDRYVDLDADHSIALTGDASHIPLPP